MRKTSLFLFLLLGIAPSMVWCQRTNARMSGTVTDASGAVVPAADLTATAVATGAVYKSETDANGFYVLDNLEPGAYRLEARKSGFQAYLQNDITLLVDQLVTVNVTLQAGAQTETITVNSAPPEVDTSSSSLSTHITPEMAVALPLNGRNIMQLMVIAPDTGPSNSNNDSIFENPETEQVYVSSSGFGAETMNYYLDGTLNEEIYDNGAQPFPNPDAIQEFSFETNNYSAKYGGRGGGVMTAVTRAGTNEFHGSLFEFVRNYAMNANSFFATSSDGLKRNQFGGSVGGPIQKDKTFFFFSLQDTYLRSLPTDTTAVVPTVAEMSGDWSAVSKQLVNPYTAVPYTKNFVNPSTYNPVAVNFMKIVPAAQNSSGGVIHYGVVTDQTTKQYVARGDHYFGSKLRMYGAYFYDHFDFPGNAVPGNLLSFRENDIVGNQNASLNFAYTFSPRTLTTLAFGWNGRTALAEAPAGTPSWQDLGSSFPNIVGNIGGGKDLYAVIGGYFTVSLPNAGTTVPSHSTDINDGWMLVRGRHTLEFGGEFSRQFLLLHGDSIGGGGFLAQATYSGNNMLDFMLGDASSFYQQAPYYEYTFRNQLGIYAQDAWKATRKLTLNLGLRWNPLFAPTGYPNTGTFWDPAAFAAGKVSYFKNMPPGMFVLGVDKQYPAGGFSPFYRIFDPRVGFAYDVFGSGKTSIRAGYGIFTYQESGETATNGSDGVPYGLYVRDTPVLGNMSNPYGNTQSPFPLPPPSANVAIPWPISTYSVFTAGMKAPAFQEWNLAVEHQLPRSIGVLQASYEGSNAYHLWAGNEENPAIYNPNLTLAQNSATTQQRRIYGKYFNSMPVISTVGTSAYDGLTITLTRHATKGLTFIGGYRWSKCLDENEVHRAGYPAYTDPYNARYDRGLCSYDVGNKLTFSYVYQLPSLTSFGLLGREVLGGWESSGILTIEGGMPFGILTGVNDSENGVTTVVYDRAEITGNPSLGGGRSESQKLQEWFNTLAFQPPAPGTYGDTSVRFLRGPSLANLDFGLQKNFPIPIGPARETQELQFRGEAFNIFNHPNFANPTNTMTSPTFGRILSANSPRIMQLSLKLVF